MSQYLIDFMEFFGLDYLTSSDPLTVQQVLGFQLSAAIGCIFMLTAIRCVFELIKTLTDWRKFC